jgi:hypothetical protein
MRRPDPRRAPRGGSLLGLLLPAPLRGAMAAGPVQRSRGAVRRRAAAASEQPRCPAASHPCQAAADPLTRRETEWLQPFAGPSSQWARKRLRHFASARTLRRPPPARSIDGHRAARRNAASRASANEFGRLGPARARDEGARGRDHGAEWSLPRRGAGAQPRALSAARDTVELPPSPPPRPGRERSGSMERRPPARVRGGHHAVVPSSGSSCPRHWAWGHGDLPCAALAWCALRRAAAASEQPRCPAASHPCPAAPDNHAFRETELASTVSPGLRARTS